MLPECIVEYCRQANYRPADLRADAAARSAKPPVFFEPGTRTSYYSNW
jgi:hypothetical protein